jgi:hypothetical protein
MWFALRNHPMALLMPQSGRRPQHQKQSFAPQEDMSAFICSALTHVGFVPKADSAFLFDYLVGAFE